MTSLPERQKLVTLITEAIEAGARKASACREAGISARTLRRWCVEGQIQSDARPIVSRAPL